MSHTTNFTPLGIAICDDDPTDCAYIAQLLKIWAHDRQVTIRLCQFPSAEAFIFCYEEEKTFDLLLLDIEMGAMDGVTLARRIRLDNESLQILFITGYSDYMAEGYDVAALHYLLKPISQKKLFPVLDKALEKRSRFQRCLNVALPGEMVRIPLHEIRYLDVHQNYVTIHAKNDCTVKRPLKDFEQDLDSHFHRMGRSVIVNLTYIRRVTKTQVHLADGAVLPLPRGAYEPLNRAIIANT